ncbi:1-phosphatidylinositol-3-phosphate 5-kinase FAB1B [Cinnamomum micranthum f. kanehirae]|uniref:1-phosphatidylinositol-3-phosphate 5-kinase n=1 Tax=Cinnamomum micranthum f. kanehirae TaxID=337451 RepID=A0A443NCH1_9MAGN|nr:1-phosphatidylinositol-3-phosphate 5-kinase FAB1B [Cinnamomum micranthum f. kanehirae]
METLEKRFSELVGMVKSWLPWRTEPANVSRDFWMPDHSCRVCYDCDSQFTIFNRRHHCRLCGRVFCAKCTANSIPAPSDDLNCKREDWERIRVCNFCFKQWNQGKAAPIDDGIQLSSPVLSPLPSSPMSLASTKSSVTGNSISTLCEPYQRVQYSSCLSPVLSPGMEPGSLNQEVPASVRNMNSVAEMEEPSPNQFGFCINRSDDEDDGYYLYCSDSEIRQFQPSDYYGPFEFDHIDRRYRLHEVHPSEGSIDAKDLTYSRPESQDSQALLQAEKIEEEIGHDNGDECDGGSPIHHVESTNATEPVDFENNGLLWLPPEPEDEEDDREAVPFDDDDDDEGAAGEWKTLRSSSSFGTGEYRSRDRSGEEHRKAMKHVVDGHFRALVSQLLLAENLFAGEGDKESWLDIVTSLSWEAATLLKPDMSKGGGMDPGGYVKVKCLACGRRSDSTVIKGVVCKKNVAHRRMTSMIKSPRFLILGGALEYQRVANNLSSFDTLLQQEMDHLKMAVAKIDAHQPDILLVEKSVSRHAQEYLLAKDISLVLNMKFPLLERIARCTGAQIVPSIDHLSSQKLGHCEMFHVEKFLEEHGSAGQGGKKLVKTMMFFDGCPKPLGCTVLLKGANGDELKKVKHVLQYGIFAAYHLALETCFLADEGASLPELPLKSPITVALPIKPSCTDKSISTIPGFTVPATGGKPQLDIQSPSSVRVSDLSMQPINPFISKMDVAITPHTSNGPHPQLTETSTLFVDLKQLPAENGSQFLTPHAADMVCLDHVSPLFSAHLPSPYCAVEKQNRVDFEPNVDNRRMLNNDYGIQVPSDGGVLGNYNQINDRKMMEDQQYSSDLSSFHQDNRCNDHALSKEEFPPSPSDHQSILVSLSTRCVWKGTVCERANLLRIKYYGSFDKPLGRFLRDTLFDQSFRCQLCEMPGEAHVHCYTHQQGSLTISVKTLPELLLPGEREGKIWMWHRCLRCPRASGFPPATRRVVMSDAAWGLSFGKFLELSFSNHAAASRVASCGHSLHRDCLRFYGFGKMVACFRYASIDVHSVYLPPPKLDFNYQYQDWIQKEADEVADKAELVFAEVVDALCQITEKRLGTGSVGRIESLESRHRIAELETVLQMEKTKFEGSLQKALKKEAMKGQPLIDILEINRLRRQLLANSYAWDRCLILAADLDNCLHLELISSIPKQEKPDSIEKPVESISSYKAHGNFSNSQSLPPDFKLDESQKAIYCSVNQVENVEKHLINELESRASISTIMNASDHPQPLESGAVVHRSFSDSQFPTMENLSHTLDAVWTGKNLAGNVVRLENGSRISNAPFFNSPVLSEAEALMHDTEGNSCNIKEEAEASSVAVMPIKGSDRVGALTNWTAVLTFYCASNESLHGSALTFEALGEYNPVYVSLFRELECQSGARLRLPVGISETVVPIYDDEPTSIISHALISKDYHCQMLHERKKPKDSMDSLFSLSFSDIGSFHSFQSFDESISESFKSMGLTGDSILSLSGSRSSLVLDPLLYTKDLHVKVSFTDENSPLGKVKYTVTCYYAKHFDALRRASCPSELDFVRSLSRCKKWGAQGGKSNVFFAKTLDDRFIIKQVTKTELESFVKFAPAYFNYLSDSIDTRSPTCLAKILGIYQVTSKHLKGGKESRMNLLVMENLLFGRNIRRLYDLKGSSRSRYNPDSSGSNKVLLDQNLIEAMPTSPIFVGNKAKRLLERAVWNDTSFLASIDVMDYSLLVGVDEEKHELVLGIIDFMRQYTWDKHLETWVKASGILGGLRNSTPTVISPVQYKKRFRKAMSAYFILVPDQCSPSTIPSRSQSDLAEDNLQDPL